MYVYVYVCACRQVRCNSIFEHLIFGVYDESKCLRVFASCWVTRPDAHNVFDTYCLRAQGCVQVIWVGNLK